MSLIAAYHTATNLIATYPMPQIPISRISETRKPGLVTSDPLPVLDQQQSVIK